MKVCATCGDTYQDFVDFCFNDGEVLVEAGAQATSQSLLPGMDVAAQPRRTSASPSMAPSATPVPRARRQGPAGNHGGEYGSPDSEPFGPLPASNVPSDATPTPVPIGGDDNDDELDAPSPSQSSLAMTEPIGLPGQRERLPVAPVAMTDTAPIVRPARQRSQDPVSAPAPPPAQREPVRAPSGPLVRATTFESEVAEPEASSRVLVFGVAAAVAGVVLLVSAVVVVLGTTSGMFGDSVDGPEVVVAPTPSMPAPLPVVPEPAPVEPSPQPVDVAPAPAPLPDGQVPPPVPDPTVAPAPTTAPVPVAPAPVAPDPVAVVDTRQRIEVSSTPAGAAVFVNGSQALAATPGVLELDPGTYTVEARLGEHLPATQSLTIVEEAAAPTLAFALEPIPLVKTFVLWDGPAAEYPSVVLVDQVALGCAVPCMGMLRVGPHQVHMEWPNGERFDIQAEVVLANGRHMMHLGPPKN